jgi:hypothetical protein
VTGVATWVALFLKIALCSAQMNGPFLVQFIYRAAAGARFNLFTAPLQARDNSLINYYNTLV